MQSLKRWSVIGFFLAFGGTFEQAEQWMAQHRTR